MRLLQVLRVGCGGGIAAVSTPTVTRNADGRLEIFAIGSDYNVYHNWQTSPGGVWNGWLPVSSTINAQGSPAAAINSDGRLEAFAVGNDGIVYQSWQLWPGGPWSDWKQLGSSLGFNGDVAVIANSDGRLEVFAQTGDQVWHSWQNQAGVDDWVDWYSLGDSVALQGQIAPAVGINSDGRLEVFAANFQAPFVQTYHAYQLWAGGSWSEWQALGYPSGSSGSKVGYSVAVSSDGRLLLFTVNNLSNNISFWSEATPGDSSSWNTIATSLNFQSESPIVGVGLNADGTLQIFALSTDGNFYTNAQTSPSGAFQSYWYNLYRP